MASEVLMTISRDEVERARLLSEFKGEMDFRTHINHAKWEQSKEIALNFKAMGLSVEQIAKGTGLSKEQVEDL